jgi:hypothetical protein
MPTPVSLLSLYYAADPQQNKHLYQILLAARSQAYLLHNTSTGST